MMLDNKIDENKLKEIVLNCGGQKAGFISTKDLVFDPYLRQLCKNNACGNYGNTWTCPPGVGELEDLKEKIHKYNKCMIIQNVFNLEDSFDFEGMQKAKKVMDNIIREIKKIVENLYTNKHLLFFSIGSCYICKTCTYPNLPCRYPKDALPSLESFGINVKDAVEKCGFSYINGKNTVSYVAGICL